MSIASSYLPSWASKKMIACLFAFYSVYSVSAQQREKHDELIQFGIASFYSDRFNGNLTTSGEIFDNHKLTAAHNSLPLGTYVQVTNLRNKKVVVVRINDRLHYRNKRLIDLTQAAAKKLGFRKRGIIRVKLQVIPAAMVAALGLSVIDTIRVPLKEQQ